MPARATRTQIASIRHLAERAGEPMREWGWSQDDAVRELRRLSVRVEGLEMKREAAEKVLERRRRRGWAS
jgi:hypothetical protein